MRVEQNRCIHLSPFCTSIHFRVVDWKPSLWAFLRIPGPLHLLSSVELHLVRRAKYTSRRIVTPRIELLWKLFPEPSSSLLLSRLELSGTTVCEPRLRVRLGTAAHLCRAPRTQKPRPQTLDLMKPRPQIVNPKPQTQTLNPEIRLRDQHLQVCL